MDSEVAERLLALNRAFYGDFAAAFSDSRAATEPGFERILSQVSPGQSEAQTRVLDLGCGQGRLAALLPSGCRYVGIDYAPEMLELARQSAAALPDSDAQFVVADLVGDPWLAELQGTFDWVILRAVLHHIPGYARRLKVVRRAAQALDQDGRLVMANWQFVKIPRLVRRALPWSELGLSEDEVEAGDYLLDWRRDGYGIRYVHLIDEAETRQLARDVGLAIDELFFADGHTDDLTLYAVLRR